MKQQQRDESQIIGSIQGMRLEDRDARLTGARDRLEFLAAALVDGYAREGGFLFTTAGHVSGLSAILADVAQRIDATNKDLGSSRPFGALVNGRRPCCAGTRRAGGQYAMSEGA